MSVDVTVVIPSYNRQGYLQRALQSCFACAPALAIEIVVVDDGSTDGSPDYVESLRRPEVTLIRQARQGPQAARNRGLETARGRYVKFLDDDDWLNSPAVVAQFALAEAEGADVCSGEIEVVDEHGALRYHWPTAENGDLLAAFLEGATTTHNLRFLTKLEVARRVRWDPTLRVRQDGDYFLRVAALAKKHVGLPQTVGYFRQHQRPRVSGVSAGDGALQHLRILMALAREAGPGFRQANSARFGALQNAVWRAAHQSAVHDLPVSETAWDLLDELSGGAYRPTRERSLLRLCDAMLGARKTERLLLAPRRWKSAWLARRTGH